MPVALARHTQSPVGPRLDPVEARGALFAGQPLVIGRALALLHVHSQFVVSDVRLWGGNNGVFQQHVRQAGGYAGAPVGGSDVQALQVLQDDHDVLSARGDAIWQLEVFLYQSNFVGKFVIGGRLFQAVVF